MGKLEVAKTPIAPTEPTWTPSVVYHNPDALWPVFGRIDADAAKFIYSQILETACRAE